VTTKLRYYNYQCISKTILCYYAGKCTMYKGKIKIAAELFKLDRMFRSSVGLIQKWAFSPGRP